MEEYDLLLRAGVRSISTNIETTLEETFVPKTFVVSNNYPNPFNSGTTFQLKVFQPEYYTVQIVNVAGRIVKTIHSAEYFTHSQNVLWDGKDDSGNDVPTGAYFARVTTRQNTQQIQLLLVR